MEAELKSHGCKRPARISGDDLLLCERPFAALATWGYQIALYISGLDSREEIHAPDDYDQKPPIKYMRRIVKYRAGQE
jgi:hypothetical protein